mmetsp:Transcript_68490/g.155198  ORF Transcript_68490/g.155198 Transcript_68490/m.155198 type:complete len:344 (-) Transcript_68490:107-1138(-)
MPPELDASLTRPRLDATLVIDSAADDDSSHQQRQQSPLFALASLNTKTASSAEVRWSQLLALSLTPQDEPVLTVGRHKDCGVHLEDPRASLLHFEVMAQRKGSESGAAPEADDCSELVYECFVRDCSSNGTAINGSIVGKGNSRQLRSGDEISVLPANRVGSDEMIAFLFRNTTESLSAPEEVRGLDLDELVNCPICMQVIYKCVALTPCSHNFCMACCSDWMRRKDECPVCRRSINAVMKNHPMDAVIEAFLNASPQWRRSEEELREMDARDQLRLGISGKLVRNVCTMDAPARPVQPAPPGGGDARPGSVARTARPSSARSSGRPGSAHSARTGSQVCALQ